MAHREIQFRRLTLPARIDGPEPVTVSGAHIVETGPPEGEPPVQWHLLTTLAFEKAETAARMVGYYPGSCNAGVDLHRLTPHTGSRPHVQGSCGPLRVHHRARNLTGGGGLVLVRKLFDPFGWPAGSTAGRTGRRGSTGRA